MNLPVVLDIAIGLIFIYLIASLLASEIQELVSTVLQWRAKHLRESIQNLLAGGQGTDKDEQIGNFLEAIYNDPLIKNMNQSSRGLIGAFGRWIYRNVFYRGRSVFGRSTTAPSYISPETFATALLERVGMAALISQLTQIRLEKFVGRIVGQYDVSDQGGEQRVSIPDDTFFQDKDYREKGAVRVLAEKAKSLSHDAGLGATTNSVLALNLNPDFLALTEEYNDILRDFQAGEANLDVCVERMKEGLDVYINQINALTATNSTPANSASSASMVSDSPTDQASAEINSLLNEVEKQQLNYFKKRLVALKSGTFGDDTERAIASGKLKPSLLEIAEVFDRASETYQEIEGAYQDIAAAYGTGILSQKINVFLNALNQQIKQLNRAESNDSRLIKNLPASLTVTDLTDPTYQPAIDEVVQRLHPEERQVYKDWQRYQQSFAAIVRAIASALQQMGKFPIGNSNPVPDNTTFSDITITKSNSSFGDNSFVSGSGATSDSSLIGENTAPQPDIQIPLSQLYSDVTNALKELNEIESAKLEKAVFAQLNQPDQQVYKGWQIYQQIILAAVRDIAYRLQDEERFFDYRDRMEFRQYPTELDDADLYQSVKYSLNLMSNEERQLRINAAARKLQPDQRKIYTNYRNYEQIQDLLADVPPSVKQSLAILARRAETKVRQTKDQLEQFNSEVSRWFDRSMGRASGVYKRNAKGVAIIIGFLIALFANTDTFHIVGRLAGDDDLRHVISTRVGSITQNTKSEDIYSREQLRQLKQNTDEILQEISLPIRWTPENLTQQFNCRPAIPVNNPAAPNPAPTPPPATSPWKTFYQACLNDANAPEGFDLFRIVNVATRPASLIDTGRIFIGWLVSGIAIAMGAPFWFDLLSKVMNVRNTGSKPASIPDKDTTKTGG